MIEAAGEALARFGDVGMLTMLLAGVIAGLIVGIIPGLGGTAAVAILLPLIYGMEPHTAMALIIGAVAVVHTSDTISTVLLGAPGSASSAVLMLDGYALARQGKAAKALSIAFLSSMAGGLIGAIGLTLSIPIARPLVLAFGSPELFMLTVLGISLTAVLSQASLLKGLMAGVLGVMIGLVGAAPATAEYRYTFGILFLNDGFSLVGVSLGVFGLAEVATLIGRRGRVAERMSLGGGWLEGARDFITNWREVLRGSLVGMWAGVLPGLGATAGTWMAYGQSMATAKDRSRYGKGEVKGIIAPESANNSVEAGDLIPTLLFGIPGGVPAAMLLGALLVYGIQPGPRIVTDHLDLLYTIIWAFALANVIGAGLCFLMSPALARLSFVPFVLLAPALVVLMFLGGFQDSRQFGDLLVMITLGLGGWILKSTGFPRAPFLIGFVLAIPLERYYFLTQGLYDGLSWVARPFVLIMLAVLVVPLLLAMWRRLRPRPDRVTPMADADADAVGEDEDEEGPWSDTPWVLATGVFFVAIFVGALILSFDFAPKARLLPSLAATIGSALSVALVGREFLRLRAGRLRGSTWSDSSGDAMRAFAWMAAFLAIGWLMGFIVAAALFVPSFLVLMGRVHPARALAYAAVVIAFFYVIPQLLPLEIPPGILLGGVLS